ncbi:hypothetical protein [Nostoc piscinale]|nr:hypothetical protein [Nostoc piscinale]
MVILYSYAKVSSREPAENFNALEQQIVKMFGCIGRAKFSLSVE